MRVTPRPVPQSQREYLRQHWVYRQQGIAYIKRPLGYGLSLVPWGWKRVQPAVRRRA
jgi:hypothetical protein